MNRRVAIRLMAQSMAAIPALAGLSLVQGVAFARERHSQAAGGGHQRAMDAHQNQTVLCIAELILPQTDTPGARALRLNEFIDLLLADSFAERDRIAFLHGLSAIDRQCLEQYGSVFTDLAPEQQAECMQRFDEAAMTPADGGLASVAEAPTPGSAIQTFATLKWLTVYGYFTSEVVVKDVLRTIVMPGRFDGCPSV